MPTLTPKVNDLKEEPRSDSGSGQLLAASGAVAGATFCSRILGLIRDVVIATQFGSSPATDAFFIAFKIPNFFRRMFAEGSFIQAFVPVLNEYRKQRSFDELQQLIASVSGVLGTFLLIFVAIGMLGAYWVILAISPGLYQNPEQLQMATDMLRVTFPYLLLISLTALAAGVLNSHQSFAIPAFTPAWLNLSMITAGLVLAPSLSVPIYALAWGVLIAGIIQLLFLMPSLKSRQLLLLPRLQPQNSGVRKVIRLMLPTMFGASVTQINLLIDLLLASFLTAGSISWLYYSDRLIELPVGLLGIGLATVLLPTLSAHHAAKDDFGFQKTLDWATRIILLFGVPASIGLILLSQPMLITLFRYGSTTAFDIQMAAMSLNAYALGLVGYMLVKIFASGFFAGQDSKTPVKVGLIAVAANLILNLALIGPLAHAGLALASALAAMLNAALLLGILIKQKRLVFYVGWGVLLVRILLASVALAVLLIYLSPAPQQWLEMGLTERVLMLSGLLLLSVGVYFSVLLLCGFRLSQLRRDHRAA